MRRGKQWEWYLLKGVRRHAIACKRRRRWKFAQEIGDKLVVRRFLLQLFLFFFLGGDLDPGARGERHNLHRFSSLPQMSSIRVACCDGNVVSAEVGQTGRRTFEAKIGGTQVRGRCDKCKMQRIGTAEGDGLRRTFWTGPKWGCAMSTTASSSN